MALPCSREDDQEKPTAASPFPGLLFRCLAQHCNVVSPKRKLRECSTVLGFPRGEHRPHSTHTHATTVATSQIP